MTNRATDILDAKVKISIYRLHYLLLVSLIQQTKLINSQFK